MQLSNIGLMLNKSLTKSRFCLTVMLCYTVVRFRPLPLMTKVISQLSGSDRTLGQLILTLPGTSWQWSSYSDWFTDFLGTAKNDWLHGFLVESINILAQTNEAKTANPSNKTALWVAKIPSCSCLVYLVFENRDWFYVA